MRKQDYLVNLINSLEPNEKRYFKLFANLQPGEKRYLKLFEQLEGETKYEAADLCRSLKLQARQLADDKQYLTWVLLQSLRNYDSEASDITELRNQKENAQSLINRRMFSFALDVIEKCLEQAWQLEAFELIGGILIMRSSCRQNLGQFEENDDTLKQHQKAIAGLTELMHLLDLRSRARNYEINVNLTAMEKLLEEPFVKNGPEKLSGLRTKSIWYETMAHYYNATINSEAQHGLALKERKLYIKHPQIKRINPIVYLTNLSRLASGGSNYEERQKEVINLQQELDNPDIKISQQRKDSLKWGAGLLSVWNLRHLGRYKEALSVAEKNYRQSNGRSEYDRFSITFEYALCLLHNGQAEKALDVTDELLRYKSAVRNNMHPFARIMHVMALLQMDNYAVLPHVVKSVKYWSKNNLDDKKELNLFLKHAADIAAAANKRPAWKALKQEVTNGTLPAMVRLLQFDAWIEKAINR